MTDPVQPHPATAGSNPRRLELGLLVDLYHDRLEFALTNISKAHATRRRTDVVVVKSMKEHLSKYKLFLRHTDLGNHDITVSTSLQSKKGHTVQRHGEYPRSHDLSRLH